MAAWVLDQALAAAAPLHAVRHRGAVGEARRRRRTPRQPPDAQRTGRPIKGLSMRSADAEIDWVIRFVTDVRSVRAEMNVPAGAKVPLVIGGRRPRPRKHVSPRNWRPCRALPGSRRSISPRRHRPARSRSFSTRQRSRCRSRALSTSDAEARPIEARDRQGRHRDRADRRQARQ